MGWRGLFGNLGTKNQVLVRDHIRWGGGGHNFFCPKNRICLRAMHFCHTWGGGGKESSSFGVVEYGTPQRGRMLDGVSPSHGGDFLEIWVLKLGFMCVINFILTSSLARNVYDCSTKGGGKPFMLLVMYWTRMGRSITSHGGDFWRFGY